MTQAINYFNPFFSNSNSLEKRKEEDATWLETLKSHEERVTKINNQLKTIEKLNARLKELDPSAETSSKPDASALKNERKERLLEIIRDLAVQQGFDRKNIHVQIRDDLYISAEAIQVTEKGGLILVYPLMLVEPQDLVDFQITGINDPKLFDDQFLESVKKHIEKILDIKENKLAIFNKKELGFLLLLMQNPEKWEKAKKFILCHELEHIHQKHTYKKLANQRPTGTYLAISISTSLLGYFDALEQILPSSLLWTVAAAATSKWVWTKWNESCERYAIELEADRGAVNQLKNIEGIDYMMKSKMEFNKVARASSSFFSLIYNSQGESLLDKFGNYPSLQERLKNATKALENTSIPKGEIQN
jgi:hypothetical protein